MVKTPSAADMDEWMICSNYDDIFLSNDATMDTYVYILQWYCTTIRLMDNCYAVNTFLQYAMISWWCTTDTTLTNYFATMLHYTLLQCYSVRWVLLLLIRYSATYNRIELRQVGCWLYKVYDWRIKKDLQNKLSQVIKSFGSWLFPIFYSLYLVFCNFDNSSTRLMLYYITTDVILY